MKSRLIFLLPIALFMGCPKVDYPSCDDSFQLKGFDLTPVGTYFPGYVAGFCFINEQVGFTSGSAGTVSKTIDGGSTWMSISTGGTELINDLIAVDENNIYGYGLYYPDYYGASRGAIVRSQDGGNSWTSSCVLPNNGTDFLDMYFADSNHGYAISAYYNTITGTAGGLIVHTANGGDSWDTSYIDILPVGITAMGSEVIVYGDGDHMCGSPDGGANWYNAPLSAYYYINSCDFADGVTGYFAEGDKIHKTTNSGVIWKALDNPPHNYQYLKALSPDTLYVFGIGEMSDPMDFYYAQYSAVGYTYSGGDDWVVNSVFCDAGITSDVAFTSHESFYMWGINETLIKFDKQ